jgi:nucleoside-diphosphate-sugar epimerase
MNPIWLVTGAQGFVGRYFIASALHSHPNLQILGIGRSPCLPGVFSHAITGPQGRIPAPAPPDLSTSSRFSYLRADILDTAEILRLLETNRPRHIIHLASGLRDDPRTSLFEINVEGTARLLETAAQIHSYAPEILLGSTGGVYGEVPPDRLPISEAASCNPIDEYSISKLAAELFARLHAQRFGFRLKIARIFNIIGPGQDERHVAGRIAAQLMRVRAGQQSHLHLGSLDSTRDFIDVRDAASALLMLLHPNTPTSTYNVGTGMEQSVNQVLEAFYEASGLRIQLHRDPPRKADISRHFADIRQLVALGFNPQFRLIDSVRAVWSYYERVWQ